MIKRERERERHQMRGERQKDCFWSVYYGEGEWTAKGDGKYTRRKRNGAYSRKGGRKREREIVFLGVMIKKFMGVQWERA